MRALLRQPKWIIFTLLVPLGVLLCLVAADWQYGRHVQRSAQDAQVQAAAAAEAVPLGEVIAPAEAFDEAADSFTRVVVSGEYVADSAALVRRRMLDGAAGFWATATLRTTDGHLLQVLRGWVPMTSDARATPQVPAPPTGPVTVMGWLGASQPSPDPLPTDLPTGQVAALDTALLTGDPANAYQPYLVALASEPTDAAELTAVQAPNIGLGPHLAYSWQWLAFAVMLPVGWVILLRRELRAEHQTGPDEGKDAAHPVKDPVDAS